MRYKRSWRKIPYIQRSLIPFLRKFLSAYSVCATVAWLTLRWPMEFVDIVGWAVLHINLGFVFAIFWKSTKADLLGNRTMFHSRMSTMQPAWPGSTTSVCCDRRCWHFCSCCSNKTIPSKEFPVTRLFIQGSFGTAFSLKITQVFVFIAWIDCKVKWHEYSHQNL